MMKISLDELYVFFLDTISKCKKELVFQSDEDISYELFEEFDIGAQSFLHDECLLKIHEGGYIDDSIVLLSRRLRNLWFALQSQNPTIEDVRKNKEWQILFDLCEEIRLKLKR